MTSRKLWRRLLATCFVGITAFVVSAWYVGGALLAPANRHVGSAPKDFPVEKITIDSESCSKIATWYARADNSAATIVLVHGIRGDRRALLDRARIFRQAGYSVVMIDLQAHGESPGKQITLGYLERHDVRAAVALARKKNPNHRIGIVGISLGGAAILLATPLDVDAIVLESVYPTIAEAVQDRVSAQVGPLSLILAPALLCQLQPRLGISLSDLRPIDKIASVACPILIASGDRDRHTTIAETQRLYDTANDPKQLVIFKGAVHTDLLLHDPETYRTEILTFFAKHFRSVEMENDVLQ